MKIKKKNNLAKGQSSKGGPAGAGHACKTRQKCTSCAYLSNVQAGERERAKAGRERGEKEAECEVEVVAEFGKVLN